jgi:hypothetical protein
VRVSFRVGDDVSGSDVAEISSVVQASPAAATTAIVLIRVRRRVT